MALVYSTLQKPAINGSPAEPPRLLDRLRFALRTKHYSYRTEQAYVHWIRRFILHHGKRHPGEMGGSEIEAFLTHLRWRAVSQPAHRRKALCAILFLYKHVLRIELPHFNAVRSQTPQATPCRIVAR